MGLCVLGKESLDELQDMVVPLFEKDINKNVDIPRWDDSPYTGEHLQVTRERESRFLFIPVCSVANVSLCVMFTGHKLQGVSTSYCIHIVHCTWEGTGSLYGYMCT